MNFTWDLAKRARNLEKHGCDFWIAEGFDWGTAITREDRRNDYGEDRYVSIGVIGDRHYVLVWTERNSDCRLISLRKANKREVKFYVGT
ncbi:MAG: BrnT family toxin [Pseudomonadota bacterium]